MLIKRWVIGIFVVLILLLSIMMFIPLHKKTLPSKSIIWIGLGGWSINVLATPTSNLNFQYAFLSINAPALHSISTSFTNKYVRVNTFNVSPSVLAEPNMKQYNIDMSAQMISSSRNQKMMIKVSNERWTRELLMGTISSKIVPTSKTWLSELGGTAGTQGDFMKKHLFIRAFKNVSNSLILVKGLEQAGNFHIDHLSYLFLNDTQASKIPSNVKIFPKGGIVLKPQQEITLYCYVEASFSLYRNIYFQPALLLEHNKRSGYDILLPATWTETFNPSIKPYPSVYTVLQDQDNPILLRFLPTHVAYRRGR